MRKYKRLNKCPHCGKWLDFTDMHNVELINTAKSSIAKCKECDNFILNDEYIDAVCGFEDELMIEEG